MTLQVEGADIAAIIEVTAWVGSIVSMLVIGLLVYLMVRPPRRRPEAPVPEEEGIDARELIRLMERMERRMEVLERAVRAEARDDSRILKAGEPSPEARRTK